MIYEEQCDPTFVDIRLNINFYGFVEWWVLFVRNEQEQSTALILECYKLLKDISVSIKFHL
jgi:hypothetical protein